MRGFLWFITYNNFAGLPLRLIKLFSSQKRRDFQIQSFFPAVIIAGI